MTKRENVFICENCPKALPKIKRYSFDGYYFCSNNCLEEFVKSHFLKDGEDK